MLELARQAEALLSGAQIASSPGSSENSPGSAGYGTIRNTDVPIHVIHKMPETKGTIGFAKSQYDVSAAVLAMVRKGGGMWVYMNGKYFPSKGRTKQMEAALLKAGIVGVTSMRSKKVVLMLPDEMKRFEASI